MTLYTYNIIDKIRHIFCNNIVICKNIMIIYHNNIVIIYCNNIVIICRNNIVIIYLNNIVSLLYILPVYSEVTSYQHLQ